MRNSIYSITLEEALAAVGGHHKYQKRVAASCCVLYFALGVTVRSLFLLATPSSEDPPGQLPASSDTPSDWVASYPHLSLIPSLYFLGVATGSIVFSSLADVLGRRLTLTASCYIALLSAAVFSSSVSPTYGCVSIPVCGLACAGVMIAGYLSLVEVTDEEMRTRGPGVLLGAGLVGYAIAGVVAFLSPNWRLLWMIAGLSWTGCLPAIPAILESPRYFAAVRGKYGQARIVLQRICDINRTPKFNDTLEGEKVIGYHDPALSHETPESMSSSPDASGKLGFVPITTGITSVSQTETTHVKTYCHWHLLLLDSIRGNFVCCFVLWLCLNFSIASLCASSGQVGNLGGVLCAAGALWFAVTLAEKIGRLHTILVGFVVSCIFCVLSTIFSAFSCKSDVSCRVNVVLAIVTFYGAWALSQAGVFSLLLYVSELFPTAIHSLTLGAFFAASGLLFAVFPYVGGVFEAAAINAVLVSGLLLLCLCPLLCLMKETLGEERNDYVQEEKEEMKKPAELSQIEIRNVSNSPKATASPFQFSPINEVV